MGSTIQTGLFDRNGDQIKVGDKVRLVLDDGEERIFDVCFKTVQRIVKSHPDFDEEYAKVAITGIVFCWEGYDLFPCVDQNGVPDTCKMEIVKAFQCSQCGCLQMDDVDDIVFCHAMPANPRRADKSDEEFCLEAFTPLPPEKQWHAKFSWEIKGGDNKDDQDIM